MEVYNIDWVDINDNIYRRSAWFHQLKDIVEEFLKNEEVVVFTILNSVGKVVFEVTDDGDLIDELDIMNKLEK